MRTVSYKACLEEMVSRVPGLFAYLEEDSYGELTLNCATASPMGCYGKVVENIEIPAEVGDTELTTETSRVVSYRSLMGYYYTHKDSEEKLVQFIKRGIGKLYPTDEHSNRLTDEFYKEHYMCPTFVYASQIRALYNEYNRLKKKCIAHNKLTGSDFDADKEGCCYCLEYEVMGGDTMLGFLERNLETAEDIATEYKGYAENAEKKLSLNIGVNLVSTIDDLGMVSSDINEFRLGDVHYRDDVVAVKVDGITSVYKCKVDKHNPIFDETLLTPLPDFDNTANWDDVTADIYDPASVAVEQQTYGESELKSLRSYKEYVNYEGVTEFPAEGEDWLFYYRVGQPTGISKILDSDGNIVTMGSGLRNTDGSYQLFDTVNEDNYNGTLNKLYVYGDVIESIKSNAEDNTIEFVYKKDVHLIATPAGADAIEIDSDFNQIKVKYKSFSVDANSDSGIRYTEVYRYEKGGEIDALVTSGLFNDYVNGTIDDVRNTVQQFPSFTGDNEYLSRFSNKLICACKFVFDTKSSAITYNIRTDLYNSVDVTTNIAILQQLKRRPMTVVDENSVILFRQDYYKGVSYAPNLDINVLIDRGSTAAFQKHIKFSEVNTLEDMENGNFFRLTE